MKNHNFYRIKLNNCLNFSDYQKNNKNTCNSSTTIGPEDKTNETKHDKKEEDKKFSIAEENEKNR